MRSIKKKQINDLYTDFINQLKILIMKRKLLSLFVIMVFFVFAANAQNMELSSGKYKGESQKANPPQLKKQ